jgi:hypothetical protein
MVLSVLFKILFVGHSLVGPTCPIWWRPGCDQMGEPAVVQAQIINGAPLAYGWDHSANAEGVDGRAVLAEGVTDLILTEAIPAGRPCAMERQRRQRRTLCRPCPRGEPRRAGLSVRNLAAAASGPGADIKDDPTIGWRGALAASGSATIWRFGMARGRRCRLIPAGQAFGRLEDEIAAGRGAGHPTSAMRCLPMTST